MHIEEESKMMLHVENRFVGNIKVRRGKKKKEKVNKTCVHVSS